MYLDLNEDVAQQKTEVQAGNETVVNKLKTKPTQ
jgi:hypothetical protein